MRFAAYSTADRLPPRLGSRARRRGREAMRQRCAVTTATASAATARTTELDLRERLGDVGVGPHEQQVARVGQEQQHRELHDEEPEDERLDDDDVDARREPAAGHEAEDQRGVDRDPQLAEAAATSVNAIGESS